MNSFEVLYLDLCPNLILKNTNVKTRLCISIWPMEKLLSIIERREKIILTWKKCILYLDARWTSQMLFCNSSETGFPRHHCYLIDSLVLIYCSSYKCHEGRISYMIHVDLQLNEMLEEKVQPYIQKIDNGVLSLPIIMQSQNQNKKVSPFFPFPFDFICGIYWSILIQSAKFDFFWVGKRKWFEYPIEVLWQVLGWQFVFWLFANSTWL